MSRKKSSNLKNQLKNEKNIKNRGEKGGGYSLHGEIFVFLAALFSIFLLISLAAYFSSTKIYSESFFTGELGFDCAARFANLFGWVSFYIPILVFEMILLYFLKQKLFKNLLPRVVNFIVLLPFLSMILDSYQTSKENWVGRYLFSNIKPYVGKTGFVLFAVCWFILFAILTFHISFLSLFSKIGSGLKNFFLKFKNIASFEKRETRDFSKPSGYIAISSDASAERELFEGENGEDLTKEAGEEEQEFNEYEEELLGDDENQNKIYGDEKASQSALESGEKEPEKRDFQVVTFQREEPEREREIPRSAKDYRLPSLDLLNDDEKIKAEKEREERVKSTAILLEQKLAKHKIAIKVVGATIGPVVTMYEVELGEAIKVNQVISMEQDLAVVVGGKRVRVVKTIPGKPYIGIEVPNEERITIGLRGILKSPLFEKALKRGLAIALGQDVKGDPFVTNLTKMPHLLVAGTTGSGKSVGINAFIVSLLFNYTPDEVKFIMVDPKGNEFNVYEGVPHLLLPVVVDSKKAAKALQWAVNEMDSRFHVLAENMVRDIASYNEKVDNINKNLANEEEKLKKMPYIVVVIDEFADLMMVAGKDVEVAVARIAQKARAVGIHLIIATQRPTRDVVTGLIKGNLPVRIAFRVASALDSRTILDSNGAEMLLGNGDMLYIPPGSSEAIRVHGAFVSSDEIKRVVNFIKSEAGETEPEDILENFTLESESDEASRGSNENNKDPLYDEMLAYIRQTGKCSSSMLQRRFSIGYNRAAKAVDMFEAEGIIGPADGAKPRVVNL